MSLKKESAFHSTSKDVLIATHWRGLAPSSTMARRQVALGSRRQQPIVQLFDQKRFTTCFENGQKLLHLQPYNLLLGTHSTVYIVCIMTVSSQLLLCTFVSFLSSLGQKSSVLCNMHVAVPKQYAKTYCPNTSMYLGSENIIWCAGNSMYHIWCLSLQNLDRKSRIQY